MITDCHECKGKVSSEAKTCPTLRAGPMGRRDRIVTVARNAPP